MDNSSSPEVSKQKAKLSKMGQKFFDLIEFDEDEQVICEIRKHPIGAFIIYVVGFAIAAAIFGSLAALSVLIPADSLSEYGNVRTIKVGLVGLGLVLATFSLVITLISVYIYRASVIFVTNEKIAQVLYKTIFNRKISQISLGEIQDVTVSQRGLLSRFFNFGMLVVETAGEQNNYVFDYVPFPYQCSKDIVAAHEASIKQYGN